MKLFETGKRYNLGTDGSMEIVIDRRTPKYLVVGTDFGEIDLFQNR